MTTPRAQRQVPVLRPPGRRYRPTGAAGFLFLFLIGIPLLFFSSALATDLTLLTSGRQQAGLVAEAAAVAGSMQHETGRAWLNQPDARRVATEVVQDSVAIDAAPTTAGMRLPSQPAVNDTRVRVTVEYRIPYSQFGRWFGAADGTYTSTRSAQVCVPRPAGHELSQGSATQGFCARPRAVN